MPSHFAVLVALEAELPGELPGPYRKWVTGVGKINAASAATRAVLDPDCSHIINYGTAGAFDAALAGRLHPVGRLRQRDMDARPLAPLGVTPLEADAHGGDLDIGEGLILSTGDNFVSAPPELASDLVDMEAYAIAKVCLQAGKGFRCLKYVTDLADSEAAANWQANVSAGAAAFRAWLAQQPEPTA